jgi:NAD(P)-dependent dehydrogenase (short-subunit alcohol dehydrogenase family)
MSSQVWFVTGASSGLGEAFARRAVALGHCVVAVARSAEPLDRLRAMAPARVLAYPADLTRPGAPAAAVEAAIARFGRIDVLINAAGAGMIGAIEETPEAALRSLLELNFYAPVAVVRAALPHLRAQRSGTVVNVSSYLGQLSAPGVGAYAASKFALEGMSEALAAEVAPFGVRVLIVEPGGFRTNITGPSFRVMPTAEPYRATLQPLKDVIRELAAEAPGDPERAAVALAELLGRDDLPLRIQFGRDSVDAVRAHSTALLGDLERWRSVAASTDSPAPTQTAAEPCVAGASA